MLGRKWAPPSTLTVPHICVSVFGTPSVSPAPLPVSLRASCQLTPTNPVVWSTASHDMNWLLVPLSSLTITGVLQLAPPSSEVITKTLVLLWSAAGESPGESVKLTYRRPSKGPPLRSMSTLSEGQVPRSGCAGIV